MISIIEKWYIKDNRDIAGYISGNQHYQDRQIIWKNGTYAGFISSTQHDQDSQDISLSLYPPTPIDRDYYQQGVQLAFTNEPEYKILKLGNPNLELSPFSVMVPPVDTEIEDIATAVTGHLDVDVVMGNTNQRLSLLESSMPTLKSELRSDATSSMSTLKSDLKSYAASNAASLLDNMMKAFQAKIDETKAECKGEHRTAHEKTIQEIKAKGIYDDAPKNNPTNTAASLWGIYHDAPKNNLGNTTGPSGPPSTAETATEILRLFPRLGTDGHDVKDSTSRCSIKNPCPPSTAKTAEKRIAVYSPPTTSPR